MQRVATPQPLAQFSTGQLIDRLGSSIERMITTQMAAYPPCWSERDKREMSEYHLGLRSRESLS